MNKLIIITRPIVLISLIILMNLVDLYLTVLFLIHFEFDEKNPIAMSVLENGIENIVWFKIVMVTIAVVGLSLTFFKSRFSQWACWVLTLIFTGLMVYWSIFLYNFLDSMSEVM